MARRTYQAGAVFQKGRNKHQEWLPAEPAYGRFWKDVPGRPRQRVVISLGVCRTRSIAIRKCSEHIKKLGIDSTRRFIESNHNVTFQDQGEIWLRTLASRKRKPVEKTSIESRRYVLDKWIYPFIGDLYLRDVNNRTMKELVEELVAVSLAPATIRDYVKFAKSVVASAVDEDGEEKFPRKWNGAFIDAPTVENQRQPTTDCEGMSNIVLFATGRYRMLYTLLAGCGPLRVGEALGLEIEKHISKDFRTLTVVQKAKRGEIQPYLKTINGKRKVDLCTPLAQMLREYVGDRTNGLLFPSTAGTPLRQANVLLHNLHPILDYLALPRGGFHMFRRFRRTYIDKFECPEALKHFWSGHAQTHVSERYIKLVHDRDFRLMWAERIGLGFELPGDAHKKRGQLLQFPKAV